MLGLMGQLGGAEARGETFAPTRDNLGANRIPQKLVRRGREAARFSKGQTVTRAEVMDGIESRPGCFFFSGRERTLSIRPR